MKYFDTELKKRAEKTRLKAAERRVLRERILSYMEYHPLPSSVRKPKEAYGMIPSFVSTLTWSKMHVRGLAGTFAAVFVVLVVPIAAERAVPGDVLYPVKTKVNESILSSFANSPYEKVAFETELLERRVAEARLLAKEGKLSEEKEAAIAETVKGHASAVQEGIAQLKTSDAEEAAIAEIAFSSTLEVQSAVLSSDEARGVGGSSEGVAGALRDAQTTVDLARGTTTPSYERLSTRVAEGVARAEDLFAAINGAVTEEERVNIERRLSEIKQKVERAEASYALAIAPLPEDDVVATSSMMATSLASEEPEVAEAPKEEEMNPISTLATTLRDIQKLILFMTDIDVRESVELEQLVPAEKTEEERTNAVLSSIDELVNARTVFDEEVETVLDKTILANIASTTSAFDTQIETASSTLANADITAAETALGVAKKYLEELKTLLEEAKSVVVEEETTEAGIETATTTEQISE